MSGFNQMSHLKKMASMAVIGSSVLLGACSDSSDDDVASPTRAEYEITVTNLTAGQPLSPLAVVLHDDTWSSFDTGMAASEALEYLAEAGDNSHLINAAESDDAAYQAVSGSGIIAPGSSEMVEVHTSANNLGTLSLSVLSMLVNTNDAFAALNAQEIGSLELNESMSFDLATYDSGTEANSESADTVPGPAAAGGEREGFSSDRDDVRDAVHMHSGVVTQDDGLDSSALTEAHRWDQHTVRVRVERVL